MEKVNGLITTLLAHRLFWVFILVLTAAQGLWYAVSFQPSMYDEARHFEITKVYSQQVGPFIAHQDPEWDQLGNLTRNSTYLFYYLMSLPLGAVTFLSNDPFVQILTLRIICIALFIVALVYYRKAFLEAGARKGLVNITMLFFVLTPGVAILPGVLNYDNAIIMLTAIMLYYSVKMIKSKDVDFKDISTLIIVGLLGSLVKYAFLALWIPAMVYLLYLLLRKHKKYILTKLKKTYSKTSKLSRASMIILVLFSGFLFTERFVVNLMQYGKISPSCQQLMNKERCEKNPISMRNMQNIENRTAKGESFVPMSPATYFLTLWAPHMVRHHASPNAVLPSMGALFFSVALIGGGLVLIYFREILLKNPSYLFFVAVMVSLIAIVFQQNYSTYLNQGVPVAMNGRYLFPITPIAILLVALSLRALLAKRRELQNLLIVVTVVVFTQGGGITTYILDNYEPVYWEKDVIRETNSNLKKIIKPLIKE